MLSLSDYLQHGNVHGWKLSVSHPACPLRQLKTRVRSCQTALPLRFTTREKGWLYHHASYFPNTHAGVALYKEACKHQSYENVLRYWRLAWEHLNA